MRIFRGCLDAGAGMEKNDVLSSCDSFRYGRGSNFARVPGESEEA